MYKFISIFSIVIRQLLLPNPFAALPNGEFYNWIAAAVLIPLIFLIVRLFYKGGSEPALGSMLFLIFYLIHTGLIMLCAVFNFNLIACVVIGVVYFTILIGVRVRGVY